MSTKSSPIIRELPSAETNLMKHAYFSRAVEKGRESGSLYSTSETVSEATKHSKRSPRRTMKFTPITSGAASPTTAATLKLTGTDLPINTTCNSVDFCLHWFMNNFSTSSQDERIAILLARQHGLLATEQIAARLQLKCQRPLQALREAMSESGR